jgi:hypothetical protein
MLIFSLLLSYQVLAQLPANATDCLKAAYVCDMNNMQGQKGCGITFDRSKKTVYDKFLFERCMCAYEQRYNFW